MRLETIQNARGPDGSDREDDFDREESTKTRARHVRRELLFESNVRVI
jgi:hypothetical protein